MKIVEIRDSICKKSVCTSHELQPWRRGGISQAMKLIMGQSIAHENANILSAEGAEWETSVLKCLV